MEPRGTAATCPHPRRVATIPVFKPLLANEELAACRAVLDEGWLGMGRQVGEFEASLEQLVGLAGRRVCAVSTGHAALHLALLLAGVGPGDEVVTASFTNIADLQAILACGADVVFADVRDDTLCLDLDHAEELIGSRTRAVIAVDYACHFCDHERLAALAAKLELRIVHDAAHSFGSLYGGRRVGSFSDIAMFSFDPVKTITCIDGGALVVRSDGELEQLREMRLIGMGQPAGVMYENRRAWTYDVRRLGFRYHLANLHAAIGLAQLAKLDLFARNRRTYCAWYEERFGPLEGIHTPGTLADGVVPFLYYLRIADGRRSEFQRHLAEGGIDSGLHWQPGHTFSLFRGCRRGDLTVTGKVADEIVTIPLHSEMSEHTLERIAAAVESFPRR